MGLNKCCEILACNEDFELMNNFFLFSFFIKEENLQYLTLGGKVCFTHTPNLTKSYVPNPLVGSSFLY